MELSVNLESSKAFSLPNDNDDINKVYFDGTLCVSLPNKPIDELTIEEINAWTNNNGDAFLATSEYVPEEIEGDFYGLEEGLDHVNDSYIAIEHDGRKTVGHIKNSEYIKGSEQKGSKIDFLGVLQKNLLAKYGVAKSDIELGIFGNSMENIFGNYFWLVGNEIHTKDEEKFQKYRNDYYEGKRVVRVLSAENFTASALTLNPAESRGEIRAVAMLENARTPNYEGTEDIDWGNVGKSLDDIVMGYYGQNPNAEPDSEEEVPGQVSDMPAAMRKWAANLTLLGEPDAEDLDNLFVLPVVNPKTYKLNKGALTAASRLASRIEDISDSTLNSVQNKIEQLQEEEFDMETSEGGKEMFKELKFETEEEYNKFLDETREGYISVASVLEKFEEVDLEENEDLDGLIKSVGSIVDNYQELQKQVKNKEIFEEREKALAKVDMKFEDLDMEKEEFINMPKASLNAIINTAQKAQAKIEKMKKSTASNEDDDFDPNAQLDIDDLDVSDVTNLFSE